VRSDLAQGVVWALGGGAIVYASWTMDRLANLGVKPFSAPGLLPGILGIFILLLGAAMLLRGKKEFTENIHWRRILLPLVLCLGFAGGMVGRGVPFWLAACIFVSVMNWTLQYKERKVKGELGRPAAISLALGMAASAAISLVFQELFLIRLP